MGRICQKFCSRIPVRRTQVIRHKHHFSRENGVLTFPSRSQVPTLYRVHDKPNRSATSTRAKPSYYRCSAIIIVIVDVHSTETVIIIIRVYNIYRKIKAARR